ncbi:MAG: M4 family metallopeptidase [Deltaproteobacteria bacterium]|nr:M4 family metallopeptidase [Deltaproteobacteria bacterium]
MRKLAFLALALVAVGCSTEMGENGGDDSREAERLGVTKAQGAALAKLRIETKREWTLVQHAKFGTPMHLEGTRGKGTITLGKSRASADVAKATISFLEQYKALYGMRDVASELRLSKSEVDELSMTHARFQQTTHGVPVVGAELAAHYDAAGRITSIDANYVAGLDGIDVQPTIDAKASEAAVKAEIVANVKGLDASMLTASEPKLVVYALGEGPARLAYEHSVRAVFGDEPAIWVTTVDAKTGEILDRFNNLMTIEASGTSVLGITKTFQAAQSGGGYVMTDATRNVRTYTAGNQQTTPGSSVSSTTLTQWDRTAVGPGAAVDAHFNASAVYDYYKTKHARNAIDGAGGALVSTAHFGNAFDNAFWDPDLNQMAYGDGGQMFRPLSAGLDVVAHEFTHGVTSATSNLRYQNQSGAMNESVSDIFGAFIEHAVKADATKNWTMGEDIAKQAGLLRDFKNPAAGQQPAHMSRYVNTQQDSGGVHINSGIPNNAAFLMTVGGTNPVSKVEVKFGIGWEKSEKLWYRANTKYFLTTTNFAQAATGVMSAAKDVALTDNEINIVDCAWKAVGVVTGACATNIVDPAAASPSGTPGTPGTPGSGETTDGTTDGTGTGDESGAEEGAGTTSTSKKPRPTLQQSSAGCSVGARGEADLGPLAGLLAAVVGLGLSRRKRAR